MAFHCKIHRHLSSNASARHLHRRTSTAYHRGAVGGRSRVLLAVARPRDDRPTRTDRRPVDRVVYLHATASSLSRLLHGRPGHLLRRATADHLRPLRTHRASAVLRRFGDGFDARSESRSATEELVQPTAEHLVDGVIVQRRRRRKLACSGSVVI